MSKQWYIVHTYSGHEAKAMRALVERAKSLGHEDAFDEVLIPEETVVEIVKVPDGDIELLDQAAQILLTTRERDTQRGGDVLHVAQTATVEQHCYRR